MSMRYPAGFISAFYNPLKNPDAPTIGTATGGNTTASVTFTAPANVGGSAITGFTVVSTPSGITGTGASSPVTVSGLSNGTAYTFTVLATNSYGNSVLSAASNSVTPNLVIGDADAGGFYAGQIGVSGVATHNLVVGPKASAFASTALQFKLVNTGGDPTSLIDGPANSAAMNDATHPAAQFCEALTIGGYTDWYLPAKNELEVCYYNLKPTTTANDTSSGINANSVPARASNYTAGNPARTSASAFINISGTEFFTDQLYWTSTEQSTTEGWTQYLGNGSQNYNRNKNSAYRVRAIRRVAV